MKKKIIAVVLLAILSLPLFADHFDISFFYGHQGAGVPNPEGINMTYGMNVGLTGRLEASIWLESMLTPNFFGDNALGLSVSFALLGERSTGGKISGASLNMLANAGIIFNTDNTRDLFLPTAAYLSITPLTLGNPIIGRRERLAEVGVLYNWMENSWGFFFSFLKLDWYARGSWKDYT